MALNIETEVGIKYTDESGTYHFSIGDEVICTTKLEKYVGRITFVGKYRERNEVEGENIICVNTSKNSTSLHEEIIKLKDIEFIYKNPFLNEKEPFGDNKDFKETMTAQGFSRDDAEKISDIFGAVAVLYNDPIAKAPAYAIQAVLDMKDGKMSDEERKDLVMSNMKECLAITVKEYLDLLDMFIRKMDMEDKYGLRLSDVLSVVSKCWDDLVAQDIDRIAEIAEKMRR